MPKHPRRRASDRVRRRAELMVATAVRAARPGDAVVAVLVRAAGCDLNPVGDATACVAVRLVAAPGHDRPGGKKF